MVCFGFRLGVELFKLKSKHSSVIHPLTLSATTSISFVRVFFALFFSLFSFFFKLCFRFANISFVSFTLNLFRVSFNLRVQLSSRNADTHLQCGGICQQMEWMERHKRTNEVKKNKIRELNPTRKSRRRMWCEKGRTHTHSVEHTIRKQYECAAQRQNDDDEECTTKRNQNRKEKEE